MLHEGHADAADHSTDALATRHLRIDDAARAIGADDAPPARLPEIRIDSHFPEHRTERMHRKALPFIAGLHVGNGFDRLAEPAQGIRKIVGAATGKRGLASLATGGLHGAAD